MSTPVRPDDEHQNPEPGSERLDSESRDGAPSNAGERNVSRPTSDDASSVTDSTSSGDDSIDDEDRMPVEVLASDFFERRRRGESISVEDIARAHPDLADEIRELFPAMMALESFKDQQSTSSGLAGPAKSIEVPDHLGDLRIVRQIGRGGMGIVYEAEQESLGRRVAVKVLPHVGVGDERRQRRFRREASAAAKLHHTNIVPVLGVGEQNGLHYYVMQLIRGVGIDELIARSLDRSGTRTSHLVNPSNTSGSELNIADSAVEATAEISSASGPLRDPSDRFESTRPLSNDQPNAMADQGSSETWNDTGDSDRSADSTSSDSALLSKKQRASYDRFSLTDRVLEALDEDVSEDILLAKSGDVGSQIGFRTIARIGLQVANALSYAHEMNVLHRDIKPANLIVDEHGIVWVTDFGLAKIVDSEDMSHTGDFVGTLRYMSPERFQGKCDHRSDIHALGLTLYELCIGQPAYESDDRGQLVRKISQEEPVPVRRLRKSTPKDLETIIHKAVSLEPGNRYQSAVALAEDLRRFLNDLPIQARRIGPIERSWRWCKRNPVTSSLVSTCVILFTIVWVLAITGYFHSQGLLASEQAQRQIAEEQRKVAESTNELAVDTLDKIYEEFAPKRGIAYAAQNLVGQDGETIQVGSQQVLTDEAARMLESLLPVYAELATLAGGDEIKYQLKALEAQRRIGDIRRQLGQFELAMEAYQQAEQSLQDMIDDSNPDPYLLLDYAALLNEMGVVDRTVSPVRPFSNEDNPWKASHQQVFTVLKSIDEEDLASDSNIELGAVYERTRAQYFLGRFGQTFFLPEIGLMREFGSRRFGGSRGDGNRSEGGRSRGGRGGSGFGQRGAGPREGGDLREGGSSRDRDGRPNDSSQDPSSRDDGRPRPSDDEGRPSEGSRGGGPPERSGDPRPGDSRQGDSRQGEPRQGEPRQGEPRQGEPRQGSGGNSRSRRAEWNSYFRNSLGDSEILDEAITGAEFLIDKEPSNVEYQFLLASCLRERATVEAEFEVAKGFHERAIAILRQLVEDHPAIPDYRYQLAQTLATDLRSVGSQEFAELAVDVQEALFHAENLVGDHPNVLSYSELMARLSLKEAEWALLEQRFEEADLRLWESVEIYLALFDRAPDIQIYRFGLANAVRLWIAFTDSRLKSHIRDDGNDEVVIRPPRPPLQPSERRMDPELQRLVDQIEDVVAVIEPSRPLTDRFRIESLGELYPLLSQAYQSIGDLHTHARYESLRSELRELREREWNSSRPPYRGRGGPF